MEPEGSLTCSQDPTTDPSPKPDASIRTISPSFRKVRFNIIFPSTPRSSN
jgi:hypothetical protein